MLFLSPHSASVSGPEEDRGEFSDHAEEAGREGGAETRAHLSEATPGQVEVRSPKFKSMADCSLGESVCLLLLA